MGFLEIPEFRLRSEGVMFKYLVFEARQSNQLKRIVRALNYAPYVGDIEEQLFSWIREELEVFDFFVTGGTLDARGGGTFALNPYYETVTLFGTSETYGVESNRETVTKILKRAFPEYEVTWFEAEA